METINVTSPPYGAVGDGATDDAAAFAKALAAAQSGDTVYVPPGTYLLGAFVLVPSGVTLRGRGASSLLVSIIDNAWNGVGPTDPPPPNGSSKVRMLVVSEAEGVTIRRLGLDVNTSLNYPEAISIQHSSHVKIAQCAFTAPPPSAGGNTVMAVSAAEATDVTVAHNKLQGMQLKMSGNNGVQTVAVTRNVISDPYQWGISLVGRTQNAVISDVEISGNTISGIAAAGGIYFGDDHNDTASYDMKCTRITIRRNTLSGTPREGGAFIQGIICSTSQDWEISRNTIHQNTAGNSTRGIMIETRYVGGVIGGAAGLAITGNKIAGATSGISLMQKTAANPGGANPFIIRKNSLTGTSGILVNGSGYTNGQVKENKLAGGTIDTANAGPNVVVQNNSITPKKP